MSVTEQDVTAVEEPFSLTADQYGRLWLHAKLEGYPVAIDLADIDRAFTIMAEKMAACGFEYALVPEHEPADIDDEQQGSAG